jgi:hypothetical protein
MEVPFVTRVMFRVLAMLVELGESLRDSLAAKRA